jgi:molybdopterin synthase sulfur carrier subunit
VREAVGGDGEERELPASLQTPRDVTRWLSGLGENYAAAFAEPDRLRCAIDQVMAPLDAPLGTPREIAFFPPVTGG